MLRVGVDLGGTKIEAVLLQVQEGGAYTELARERVPTERDRGYRHVLTATVELVQTLCHTAGCNEVPPVGVGMPGGVTHKHADGTPSPTALVKNSNTTCLNGRPFRADLQEQLRTPVRFANDANCFALAEATFGAAKNAPLVFGVIMGTGVGGGIALREGPQVRTWDGLQGIAGEWGHVVLEPRDGPPCYCGKRGCIEQYLSGPAIERAHRLRTGDSVTLPELSRRADGGDHEAQKTLMDLCDHFGRAMATVIDILDPSIVVLGGGVSNVHALYKEGIAAVERWVFNDGLETPIVRHALGDSAGVLGAAML